MNKIGQHGQGPEEYAVGLLFLLILITKSCMFRIFRI